MAQLDTLKKMTSRQKLALIFLLLVITSSAFIWFVFIPTNETISQIEIEISELNNDINIQRVKIRRLEDLKQENKKLQHQLTELKEQLPPEAEVALLLKQVSELGGRSGLDFKLWKPAPKKVSSSGLYIEIPVNIEVAGAYHSVGIFFDKISKLKRIINISNIKMSSPKIRENFVTIQTRFSATAFASVESENGQN